MFSPNDSIGREGFGDPEVVSSLPRLQWKLAIVEQQGSEVVSYRMGHFPLLP